MCIIIIIVVISETGLCYSQKSRACVVCMAFVRILFNLVFLQICARNHFQSILWD